MFIFTWKKNRLASQLMELPIDTPTKITKMFFGHKFVLEITRDGKRKLGEHVLIKKDGTTQWRYEVTTYDENGENASTRTGVYPASFANK